jgi:hypothetical protein
MREDPDVKLWHHALFHSYHVEPTLATPSEEKSFEALTISCWMDMACCGKFIYSACRFVHGRNREPEVGANEG